MIVEKVTLTEEGVILRCFLGRNEKVKIKDLYEIKHKKNPYVFITKKIETENDAVLCTLTERNSWANRIDEHLNIKDLIGKELKKFKGEEFKLGRITRAN